MKCAGAPGQRADTAWAGTALGSAKRRKTSTPKEVFPTELPRATPDRARGETSPCEEPRKGAVLLPAPARHRSQRERGQGAFSNNYECTEPDGTRSSQELRTKPAAPGTTAPDASASAPQGAAGDSHPAHTGRSARTGAAAVAAALPSCHTGAIAALQPRRVLWKRHSGPLPGTGQAPRLGLGSRERATITEKGITP